MHNKYEELMWYFLGQIYWGVEESVLCTPNTARKEAFSNSRELPVCTSFLTGTAPSVLNASTFSTGRADRYKNAQFSTGW